MKLVYSSDPEDHIIAEVAEVVRGKSKGDAWVEGNKYLQSAPADPRYELYYCMVGSLQLVEVTDSLRLLALFVKEGHETQSELLPMIWSDIQTLNTSELGKVYKCVRNIISGLKEKNETGQAT